MAGTTARRIAAGAAALVGASLLAPAAAGAVDPSADLSVAVSHGPSAPMSGQELTFTLTATNDGPDTATDVLVAMSYDYPLDYTSASDGCTPSRGSASVICKVGDLASGTSTSVDVTFVPQASGVFTVPVATASPTPDPDTLDRSSSDTVIVQKGPSIGERYVAGELPVVLERPATPADQAYWGARFNDLLFNSGRNELLKVPSGWINSNEYRRLRVREAYQRILERPASATDVAYWVPKLAKGLPYDAFDRRLVASNEFAAVWQGGVSDQVDGIVHATLGRGATDAEVDRWGPQLASGRRTRASVTLEVQQSASYRGRVVDALYQKVFGAAPSKLGRYAAILDLGKGTTPEQLLARLLIDYRVLNKYPVTEDDFPYESYDFSRMSPLP
ncbi:MAG: hypothetical protein U0P45_07920 [Acidimicrobiales bacterium]